VTPTPRAATRPPRLALLLALAAASAAGSGCPLPQALPEYPSTGTIAPPRILSDRVTPGDSVIEVDPACATLNGTPPSFLLTATLVDEKTLETVDARWFVDYLAGNQARQAPRRPPDVILGPQNGLDTLRTVPAFEFQPNGFDDQPFRDLGGLHVVELVVSNGFAAEPAAGLPPLARPWRTPADQFETQVYRWVFHYVPGGTCQYPVPVP